MPALTGAEIRALRAKSGGAGTLPRRLRPEEVYVLVVTHCISCGGEVLSSCSPDNVPDTAPDRWLCSQCADF